MSSWIEQFNKHLSQHLASCCAQDYQSELFLGTTETYCAGGGEYAFPSTSSPNDVHPHPKKCNISVCKHVSVVLMIPGAQN